MYRENTCRITLLSSQHLPVSSLFYPVWHCSRPSTGLELPDGWLNTVNIYRYKTIEANGNTGVILTTSKSFSLYREFLSKRFASSWNDTSISISLFSFVPIDIYSELPVFKQGWLRFNTTNQ